MNTRSVTSPQGALEEVAVSGTDPTVEITMAGVSAAGGGAAVSGTDLAVEISAVSVSTSREVAVTGSDPAVEVAATAVSPPDPAVEITAAHLNVRGGSRCMGEPTLRSRSPRSPFQPQEDGAVTGSDLAVEISAAAVSPTDLAVEMGEAGAGGLTS